MLSRLSTMVGCEHRLDDVNRALREYARQVAAPVVGAVHVTCADESEWECSDSFQRCVVDILLPTLRSAEKAAFRLFNLGGRYESGALAVAESHFATPESRTSYKLLIVKLNSHVGVLGGADERRYGKMARYETESTACGALHALLAGGEKPFLQDLRRTFCAGHDRLAALRDPQHVPPAWRSLFVALVNARLQADQIAAEIEEHAPLTPTLYAVASCVTFNRVDSDTEFLVGLHTADGRHGPARCTYWGLGDDPARYRPRYDNGRLFVSEAK